METSEKVLTVVLAAEDTGHEQLPDPLLQALVHELKCSDKLQFPLYSFGRTGTILPESARRVMYPYSPELDEDMSELVLLGRVERHWSVLTYVPTERAREAKGMLETQFKNEEPDWTYEKLKRAVHDYLSSPHALLEDSYRNYMTHLTRA